MIHIQKGKTPDFLAAYVEKNPTATYDTESFKTYYQTWRDILVKEQKGLCAYCCSKITVDTCHNEHIEPRHRKDGTYSKKSLDHNNIVASCNTLTTCGRKKENDYDEQSFVSPLQDNCESIFTYDPDGYMRGDEYTIALLNLNSYELQKARKAVYRMIMNMSAQDIRLCFCSDQTTYTPYSNVIFWYLREFFGSS